MCWLIEHHGSLEILACSLTALVLVYSWGDGISPFAVIKKIPSALRLVAGSLLLIGTGNFVIWAPGLVTMMFGVQWLGPWGMLLCWPGLWIGCQLFILFYKPLLAVYYVITGTDK